MRPNTPLKQAQAEVDGADVAIDRATAQARSAEAAVALAQARFDDVTPRSPLMVWLLRASATSAISFL